MPVCTTALNTHTARRKAAMNFTRTHVVSTTIVLAVGLALYYYWRPQPIAPITAAVFVRSDAIQHEYVPTCELQLNGKPFSGTKHVLPRNSELHVSGRLQYNPKHVSQPSNGHGLLVIGYRPKGSPESAWTMGSPEHEWVGAHGNGNGDFKTKVTAPAGEYDLRAYVLLEIFGLELPKVEYVAQGVAEVTESSDGLAQD